MDSRKRRRRSSSSSESGIPSTSPSPDRQPSPENAPNGGQEQAIARSTYSNGNSLRGIEAANADRQRGAHGDDDADRMAAAIPDRGDSSASITSISSRSRSPISDHFGSSMSTDTTSASESDAEDAAVSLQDRLLLHAKSTALALQAPATAQARGADLTGMLKGSDGGRKGSSRAGKMEAALRHLKEELTKPVEESTALTIVNVADESAEVLSRLMTSKIPVAAPEERKALRKLQYVDHIQMHYTPIRRDFYVVPPDVRDLSESELRQLWKELDGAKVRGPHPPRPLRSWHGTGLPDDVLTALQARHYSVPFAVQSLGAPALMSGRDLLVTAKTGSGKTLCYVLPMLRHCIDQPRAGVGEGPIGLVLVPTQELATQIFSLVKDLCRAAGLRCVASYGSTPLRENVLHAKGGCDVMVATPGRLLDLLTTNGGKSISLSRTSFVVVDEADRLFDSGFMEHIVAFLRNVRPDRQLAMISATMPKELRRLVLGQMRADAIEISVGGKPTPASNVEQTLYMFDEEVYEVDEADRKRSERFLKLLEIIGDESSTSDGQQLILIFTQRREDVDELHGKMAVLGYHGRVATLYGGMDPIDREFALEHFKPGSQFILIATGVAERGLDIPYLDLVINYTLPDHFEAYVHRIGRTGRAGRPGRAISFFVRGKDDDIAPELVEGLERAGQKAPEELYELAAKVRELRKDGHTRHNASFFRGYMKGRKQQFEDRNQKELARQAAKAAGLDGFASSSSSEDDGSDSDTKSSGGGVEIVQVSLHETGLRPGGSAPLQSSALTLYGKQPGGCALVVGAREQEDRIAKAIAFAQKTTDVASASAEADDVRFQCEYLINDLPDVVRGKLQQRKFLDSVADETHTSIIRKGIYYDPKYKHSHRLKEGERPLYLLIVGRTSEAVREAREKMDGLKNDVLSHQRAKVSSIGATL